METVIMGSNQNASSMGTTPTYAQINNCYLYLVNYH
jgi:hypothetical protein